MFIGILVHLDAADSGNKTEQGCQLGANFIQMMMAMRSMEDDSEEDESKEEKQNEDSEDTLDCFYGSIGMEDKGQILHKLIVR